MSGRGKGGKGLGKGGAKRHRKVLRDNIQGEQALTAMFDCNALSMKRPCAVPVLACGLLAPQCYPCAAYNYIGPHLMNSSLQLDSTY